MDNDGVVSFPFHVLKSQHWNSFLAVFFFVFFIFIFSVEREIRAAPRLSWRRKGAHVINSHRSMTATRKPMNGSRGVRYRPPSSPPRSAATAAACLLFLCSFLLWDVPLCSSSQSSSSSASGLFWFLFSLSLSFVIRFSLFCSLFIFFYFFFESRDARCENATTGPSSGARCNATLFFSFLFVFDFVSFRFFFFFLSIIDVEDYANRSRSKIYGTQHKTKTNENKSNSESGRPTSNEMFYHFFFEVFGVCFFFNEGCDPKWCVRHHQIIISTRPSMGRASHWVNWPFVNGTQRFSFSCFFFNFFFPFLRPFFVSLLMISSWSRSRNSEGDLTRPRLWPFQNIVLAKF